VSPLTPFSGSSAVQNSPAQHPLPTWPATRVAVLQKKKLPFSFGQTLGAMHSESSARASNPGHLPLIWCTEYGGAKVMQRRSRKEWSKGRVFFCCPFYKVSDYSSAMRVSGEGCAELVCYPHQVKETSSSVMEAI